MTLIWYQCPIKQYVSIIIFLLMVHADDYVFRLEILASTPGTETELV